MDVKAHTLGALLSRLLGMEDGSRQHRIEVEGDDAVLLVERWHGREVLSQGFSWWVDVLSTDAGLLLDAWLGQPARILTRRADGSDAVRSGVVREVQCLGSEGGLARYRITLVPWVWLLSQGRHSRVFQDLRVLEIVDAVFGDYAPLATWGHSDELGEYAAGLHPRSYCVQYRESDSAFVSRLLAEEGIGWRVEEDDEAPSGHRVVLFSGSGLQPEDATSSRDGGVRFHRSNATEQQDAILAYGRMHRLGPAQITLQGYDYKATSSLSARLDLNGPGRGEAYDPTGQYSLPTQAQGEHYALVHAQAEEAARQPWQGEGTARTFRAGTWFTLTQAPEFATLLLTEVEQLGVNNLPTDLRAALDAWLDPPPVPVALSEAVRKQAVQVGYASQFRAVARDLAWRPVLIDGSGTRLNPKPTVPGYQSAIVVGGAGEDADAGHEVHMDHHARIKVRFHWQQGRVQGDKDTCWLRVAQRYAGPGVGSQFIPRIGQEVLVAFLEGDIDRPLVVGALYNGKGECGIPTTPGGQDAEQDLSAYADALDHRISAQGNQSGGHAPPWHGMGAGESAHRNATALWGVKSKEWGGGGHTRLVFDDSDGELRLQLATTQAYSELNLGHLIHQADNYRGSFRGEGFELRTDAWGAIRADRGLWLSTYALEQMAPAGEAVGPTALLTQLKSLGEMFSGSAKTHMTVTLAAHEGVTKANQSELSDERAPLKILLESVKTTVTGLEYGEGLGEAPERKPNVDKERVPHTGDALLGFASPVGIGMVAGQTLGWHVGETLTLASGGPSNVGVADNLRLHSGQAIGLLSAVLEGQPREQKTLSVVAGEGELDVQAQNDVIRVQSRDHLKMVSANADVELVAGKTIHMATAGGASLTIEGGNITFACPGKITVHASKKSFVGPTQLSREMNTWPESKFDQRYVVRYLHSGEPIRNWPVEIVRADGAKIRTMTDGEGRLPIQRGNSIESLQIRVLRKHD